MTDDDIRRVVDFWFSADHHTAPTIDSRMERWFSAQPEFDNEIRERFGSLVKQASAGELQHWSATGRGRLALILLLDQFRRHLYRGTAEAFAQDAVALRLCIEGAAAGDYRSLAPLEQAFYFMPLQHAENGKAQEKSVRIYAALAESGSETLRETLLTFAHFAELHRDIIAEFGRFPHRNRLLGRPGTAAEEAYLDAGAEGFGQAAGQPDR